MCCQQVNQTFTQWISNPDTILAIVVIVVSLLSFGFTVYHSRKVLNLSLAPFLHGEYNFREGDKIILKLINSGNGIARIVDFNIKYDREKLNDLSEVENKLREFFIKNNLGECKISVMNFGKLIIATKEILNIIEIKEISDQKTKDFVINELVKMLHFDLVYEDINGKKYKTQ